MFAKALDQYAAGYDSFKYILLLQGISSITLLKGKEALVQVYSVLECTPVHLATKRQGDAHTSCYSSNLQTSPVGGSSTQSPAESREHGPLC